MRLRFAALLCAVLLACMSGSVAGAAEQDRRHSWEYKIDDILYKTTFKEPVECLSAFCTSKPVVYSLDITNDGLMTNIRMEKSSGDDVLDSAMLRVLKKFGPFPTWTTSSEETATVHRAITMSLANPTPDRVPGDEGRATFDDLRSRQPLPGFFPH